MSGIAFVTGGAGFIGSHLVDHLLQEGMERVVVLDNLSSGKLDNLPENHRLEVIKGEVTDQSLINRLFHQFQFNSIFHLAAEASVQESIHHPWNTHQVNFDSTLLLLENSKNQTALKRFVFASSAAVYGDKPELPCREDHAVNPLSPYGVDKYASERYVLNAFQLYGIPSTVFRFFNVYGPRQNPSSPYSGVISIFLDKVLKKESIKVFGDGNQTRDFIYVRDLIDAILWVSKQKGAVGEVYNLGTGKETSLNDLIQTFQRIAGGNIPVEYGPQRDGDIKRSVADIGKLSQLGCKLPDTTLVEGLNSLLYGVN